MTDDIASVERSRNNARRARQVAAQVAGPVPAAVYAAVLASGPCIYCGAEATTVEHIRPLNRDGWEHESNLVPACGPCNFSKWQKLLTEWAESGASSRVAHAVATNAKVACEWTRLTTTSGDDVRPPRLVIGPKIPKPRTPEQLARYRATARERYKAMSPEEKVKRAAYNAAWREANRAERLAKDRAYNANRRERARLVAIPA